MRNRQRARLKGDFVSPCSQRRMDACGTAREPTQSEVMVHLGHGAKRHAGEYVRPSLAVSRIRWLWQTSATAANRIICADLTRSARTQERRPRLAEDRWRTELSSRQIVRSVTRGIE